MPAGGAAGGCGGRQILPLFRSRASALGPVRGRAGCEAVVWLLLPLWPTLVLDALLMPGKGEGRAKSGSKDMRV